MPKNLYGQRKPIPAKNDAQQPSDGQSADLQSPPMDLQQEEHATLPEPLTSGGPPRSVALSDLPLEVIVPNPFQARKNFDPGRLQGLANSMQEHGVITRIRVRKIASQDDEERYELVYGERRWRAARLAGLTHYPVEIAPYSDDEMVEVGLLENVQREDLTPLEEAETYQRLLAQTDEQGQPRYSIRKLADRLGKDKSYIEMRLAVLRSPEDVQQLVREQPEVPLRSAYEVSKVEDPEKREEIITDIREGKLKGVEPVKIRVREATSRVQEQPVSSTPPVETAASEGGPLVPVQGAEPGRPTVLEEVPPAASTVSEPQEEEINPVVTVKSSIEIINASLDSAQALVLFEQQLQKDNSVFLDIVHRLTADTEALTAAQREVLVLYIDRWGRSLMDLKGHVRSTRSE